MCGSLRLHVDILCLKCRWRSFIASIYLSPGEATPGGRGGAGSSVFPSSTGDAAHDFT